MDIAIVKNNLEVSINNLNMFDYVTHQLNLQNLRWTSGAGQDKVSHHSPPLSLLSAKRSGQNTKVNSLRTLKIANGLAKGTKTRRKTPTE